MKKKLMMLLLAFCISICAYAGTGTGAPVTINVVNNSVFSCNYTVTVRVDQVPTSGIKGGTTFVQTFDILQGSNHNYVFTPATGYYININSLSFIVKTASYTFTYGPSQTSGPVAAAGNCFNPTYPTIWTPLGLNNFEVRADVATGGGSHRMGSVIDVVGNEANDLKNVHVYPNPADQHAELSLKLDAISNIRVGIYNLTGVLIAENRYENQEGTVLLPVDLKDFAAGLYFMNVLVNDKLTTIKLLKE
ncbi:MAG: T9SS type A sorting domain-containing protein [Bacteroidota bacterium]